MKIQFRYSVFVFIFFISLGNVSAKNNRIDKTVSILNNKPVFTLRVENSGAAFDLHLNGIRVQKDLNVSNFSADIPVNQYMTSGVNRLVLYSFLNIKDNKVIAESATKVLLMVKGSGAENSFSIATISSTTKGFEIGKPEIGSSNDVKLNSLRSFFPDKSGDVEIGELVVDRPKNDKGLIKYSLDILINNSLPRWKFLDSTRLKYVDEMSDEEWNKSRDELAPIYREIQKAVVDGNIDYLMPLFEERNEELDAAFYYEPGSMKNKLRASFLAASKDKGLEATSMSNKKFAYVNSKSGQLSRLVRASKLPAITFNFKDAMGSQSYDIWFRKEGDKWIISR